MAQKTRTFYNRGMNLNTTFKKTLKILTAMIIIAVILYVMAWIPVADRLIRWCEYYPASLADCREWNTIGSCGNRTHCRWYMPTLRRNRICGIKPNIEFNQGWKSKWRGIDKTDTIYWTTGLNGQPAPNHPYCAKPCHWYHWWIDRFTNKYTANARRSRRCAFKHCNGWYVHSDRHMTRLKRWIIWCLPLNGHRIIQKRTQLNDKSHHWRFNRSRCNDHTSVMALFYRMGGIHYISCKLLTKRDGYDTMYISIK